MSLIFIEGDFPTGKKCKYHCSPTCHPGQIDETIGILDAYIKRGPKILMIFAHS